MRKVSKTEMPSPTHTTLSDEEFLQEISESRDAFYRFIARTVRNKNLVDDVFSAAVLVAYEHRSTFSIGTNFRAWMFRILLKKCRAANCDSTRARRLRESHNEARSTAQPNQFWRSLHDLEDVLEECGHEVHAAFETLSFSERVCLLLRLVEQLSYQEIAEIMEIPTDAVVNHLAKGRRSLRSQLADYARRQRIVRLGGTPFGVSGSMAAH